MPDFISFFIVLFAALVFSEVFKRLHLPWVVALIIGGVAIGPFGLGLFEVNQTIDFLGQVGLVFLMFIAGLESRFDHFSEMRGKVLPLAISNGLIPFVAGTAVGLAFGYDITASLLVGVIFISSSIAVVIPSLESSGMLHSKLGKSIVASTIIQDIASLILLSVLLQSIDPITNLPLPLFYGLLFLFLIVLKHAIPKIRKFFERKLTARKKVFEDELRGVFVILLGIVIVFEVLGLHPIIAGFFAGLALSSSIKSDILKDKLRTISYGLFIPVFFIVIGAKTDLSILRTAGFISAVVVATSIVAKWLSGFVGAKLSKFSWREAKLIASATLPQLSTTLAATFAAFELGIIGEELVTAFILLSIVTTLLAPVLIKQFSKEHK